MGEIGKTTHEKKKLYHDLEVKEKFDLKGWTYISNNCDDIVQVLIPFLNQLFQKQMTIFLKGWAYISKNCNIIQVTKLEHGKQFSMKLAQV